MGFSVDVDGVDLTTNSGVNEANGNNNVQSNDNDDPTGVGDDNVSGRAVSEIAMVAQKSAQTLDA